MMFNVFIILKDISKMNRFINNESVIYNTWFYFHTLVYFLNTTLTFSNMALSLKIGFFKELSIYYFALSVFNYIISKLQECS